MNFQKIIQFSIGPVGAALLGLLTTPLLTWFFSVDDIGRYSVLQIAITFSTILFSLGLDQAFVRDFHEHNNPNQIFKIALIPGLAALILISTTIIIFAPSDLSKRLYQLEQWQLSIFTIISCISAFIIRFLSLYLRMEERGLAFSLSQLLPKLLFLTQIVILYLATREKQFEFLILLQIQTTSLIVVMFLLIYLNRVHLIPSLATSWNHDTFLKMLKYGLPLILSGIIYWVVTSTGRLALLQFSNFKELGIYSAVTSIAAGAAILSSIFNILWAPSIYKWHKEGVNHEQLFKINAMLLALVYFICIFTSILSWIFPLILPPTYNSIRYLLAAAVLQPLLYTLSEATSIGITIQRKTSLSIIISLVALLTNIILCLLLTPKLGAQGTILATAWSFWIFFILRTEISSRMWISLPRIKMYLMTLLATLIATIIAIYTPSIINLLFILTFALSAGIIAFRNQLHYLRSIFHLSNIHNQQ